MGGLDQLAISRILGSTVQPYSRAGFGGFSAARAVGGMLASRPKPPIKLAPDDERDAKIIAAFAATHKGFSLDRTLADPELAGQFVTRCHRLGVKAPHAAICRRLLRIRKDGRLTKAVPTTNTDEDRILEPFLIPAELAFAQLSYRYDASYDDMLSNPEIGEAFDDLAAKIGLGNGDRVDYRLAALHLRKNVRSRKKGDAEPLAKIRPSDIERRWHPLGTLSQVSPDTVPAVDGILSLAEPHRYLYLTHYPNLRSGVTVFKNPGILSAMANRFWTPSPDSISLRVMKRDDLRGQNIRHYEMKSLEVYRPVFNMLPTEKADAA